MNLNFQSKNARGKIDTAAGIIRDVSVITVGDAIGHGFSIDAKTLATVKAAADKAPGGLKVKVNHGTGADAIVGVLRNFRVSGSQVIADLSLLKSNPFTARLLEMAREIPDAFGLSISFGYTAETIDKVKFIRVTELDSCDVVDTPAANPGGLFSALSKSDATPAPLPDEGMYMCPACGASSIYRQPATDAQCGVTMKRSVFEILAPGPRAQFIRAGGRLID